MLLVVSACTFLFNGCMVYVNVPGLRGQVVGPEGRPLGGAVVEVGEDGGGGGADCGGGGWAVQCGGEECFGDAAVVWGFDVYVDGGEGGGGGGEGAVVGAGGGVWDDAGGLGEAGGGGCGDVAGAVGGMQRGERGRCGRG